MTINEYKKQNPGKIFYLKGTQGHIFHPIAVDGLIPEIYNCEIRSIGRMKVSGVTCLRINWNFLTSQEEDPTN